MNLGNAEITLCANHQTRSAAVLNLSEILLQHYDMDSFEQLVDAVREGARTERFFRMDIKPPFADTPENWEDILESAFSGALPGNK